jgi:hypothetical protein
VKTIERGENLISRRKHCRACGFAFIAIFD